MNLFLTFPWSFWQAVGPVANTFLRNWPTVDTVVKSLPVLRPTRLFMLDLGSSLRAVWN